jgi:hypothetical protein
MFLYFEIGGFLLTPSQRATPVSSANELSCTLECLFDSRGYGLLTFGSPNPSTEGYRYLGISLVILILLSSFIKMQKLRFTEMIERASKYFKSTRAIKLFYPSFVMLIFSFGPTWHIQGHAINLPMYRIFNPFFESFRATGRFMIPTVCLLVATSVLVIDKLNFSGVKLASICCILLVLVQSLEIARLYNSWSTTLHVSSNSIFKESASLHSIFQNNKDIQIIEANSGDIENIPWQEFSYYSLKNSIPINSFHYLARYNYAEAAKEQFMSVSIANSCSFSPGTIFVIRDGIFDHLNSSCKFKLHRAQSDGAWGYYLVI